jgi:gas vesicle protein
MSKSSKFMAGAFMGAAVGGILSVLFAPKSGEELRKELQEKSAQIIDEVQKAASQAQQEMEKEISSVKEAA